MAISLDITELEPTTFSVDEVGQLLAWKGRLLRGIVSEAVQETRRLFECGLVETLIEQELLVNSWITDYAIEGYELVIEHEKIPVQTYPYEWSFDMLKDAALAVLKINRIAAEYGYLTKDAHGYNLIFWKNRPYFVDLGSFQKVPSARRRGWMAYEEFMRFYYYPLKLWRQGNSTLARRALLCGELVPIFEFLQYQSKLIRLVPAAALKVWIFLYYKYKQVNVAPQSVISDRLSKTKIARLVSSVLLGLRRRRLLPFASVNLKALTRRTARLRNRRSVTFWQGYHEAYFSEDGTLQSTPRFDRIVNMVNELAPETVFELGGNRGLLSHLLLDRTTVTRVICSDYDEKAIDGLYVFSRERGSSVIPVLMNSVFPLRSPLCRDTHERFRSQAVIALALTHHLVLTQGIPLDFILGTMKRYTTQYVLVEFMPLGLYDGRGRGTLPFPTWYNVDWFRDTFAKHFDLLHEEQLEKNRILFVGVVPTQGPATDGPGEQMIRPHVSE